MDAPFRQYLGCERFPENLTEPEVAHFFSLSEVDRRAVRRRRRPLNRLGVALQVGFLRLTGAPLNSVEMIPPQVLAHLGAELGIAPPRLASIRALYRRHRTLFEHQDAAKQALGLRDLTEHATQPEFVYVHKWTLHDLIMWDNRQTMHRVRRYDQSQPRDMRRATVAGTAPTVAQQAAE